MAPSKIRRALGAVKDQTSIGIAMVTSSNPMADLEVAIVKATRHVEQPPSEKYISEIINLTSYSRTSVSACVSTLCRRLNKTHNWVVALKTLMLIHRLLSEGDPAYEQEIFLRNRRGTRLLNMSDFRDSSRSGSWNFSSFVRTYALYLDEQLEFRMNGRCTVRKNILIDEDEEEEEEMVVEARSSRSSTRVSPIRTMKIEKIFTKTQQLQQLLQRFLASRPTGEARSNRLVMVTVYHLVTESFKIYCDIAELMSVMIDRFMDLQVPDCMKVFEIFCGISKQFSELENFYNWCKTVGIARTSEYPQVEKITPKRLAVMEEFIHEKAETACSGKTKKKEDLNTVVDEEPKVELALPAPEGFVAEKSKEEEEKKNHSTREEVDLLNLKEEAERAKELGDCMALALFAGDSMPPPTWESFEDEPIDWETALVQSASKLANQKVDLGGGFDMLTLNSMYEQAGTVSGSASSMSKPTPLALPSPPMAGGEALRGDPFAASVLVPPPAYMQMWEMERNRQLLAQEQFMWQQYARDGMQGSAGLARLQPYPHTMGGYPHPQNYYWS